MRQQQEATVNISPAVGLTAIVLGTVTIAVAAIVTFGGGNDEFQPPAGYISTNQQEQDLFNLHEAAGTLRPNPSEKTQRVILNHARLLCKQLDDKVTTVTLAIASGKQAGLTNAETMTDFAISSLCPQHKPF